MNINTLENVQVMNSLVDYTKLGVSLLRRKEFLLGSSLVNGEWVDSPATINVNDPATGQLICSISSLGVEYVDEAVDASVRAFPVWASYLPRQRGNLLRKWAALMRENQDDLAVLITLEQGKPLDESRGEIEYGAGFVEWFAEEAERLYGETLPSHKPGRSLSVVIQPVGVAACITPWNFPSAMIARKVGAALAVGCTMIVKPAPETPLSALALVRLAEEAGIPSGVLQVIVGEAAPLSKRLLERKEVRAFSFTGSTEVGRLLLGQAAATVKKVSLELGGNAPFIIFDDVLLDKAVEGCMAAKFATSGQDCLAANRIYVQRGIYNEFIERFSIKVAELRVGHGLESGVVIGPMTRLSAAEKCRRLIADAVEKGARVVTSNSGCSIGYFVSPTVVVDVTDGMLIATEEIFGPLAAILPFDDEDEVIRRANNTEMGLAAYVFTNDLARSSRIVNSLEYGMVAVNTASFTGPPIPFGGWKQSGLGREGSRHGTAEYTEMKYICVSLNS
jgi:succinate-semialdehyde dehydrogenase/glutarate-semialdehyde dehydrogenase/aspartate-semialdehyde dehydrogenase